MKTDFFGKLARSIKSRWKNLLSGLRAYFKRLLSPIYLFPIKLLTYSFYYLLKFFIKLIIAFLGLVIDCLCYPFKSLKHLLKAVVIVGEAEFHYYERTWHTVEEDGVYKMLKSKITEVENLEWGWFYE